MKKNNYTKIVSSLIIFLFIWQGTDKLLAQELKVVRDFKVWSGVEIEKAFKNNWKVSVQEEIRLQKNATQTASYFTQLGLDYDINKNFTIDARYRYIRNRKSNLSYETRSRYSLDLKYKGELKDFSVHSRLRYQKEVESLDLLKKYLPYEKSVRYRLEGRYRGWKDLTPGLSAELFQLFASFSYPDLEKIRLMASLEYDLNTFGEIELAYAADIELAKYNPYAFYILQLNYTYKF